MNAAHGGHLVGDADGVIQREHDDLGGSGARAGSAAKGGIGELAV